MRPSLRTPARTLDYMRVVSLVSEVLTLALSMPIVSSHGMESVTAERVHRVAL